MHAVQCFVFVNFLRFHGFFLCTHVTCVSYLGSDFGKLSHELVTSHRLPCLPSLFRAVLCDDWKGQVSSLILSGYTVKWCFQRSEMSKNLQACPHLITVDSGFISPLSTDYRSILVCTASSTHFTRCVTMASATVVLAPSLWACFKYISSPGNLYLFFYISPALFFFFFYKKENRSRITNFPWMREALLWSFNFIYLRRRPSILFPQSILQIYI